MKKLFLVFMFFVGAVGFVVFEWLAISPYVGAKLIANGCFAHAANGQSKKMELSDVEKATQSAILMEANTGTVLFEKNSDKKLPMASMTKLMTIALVLDEIDAGRLNESQLVEVSAYAASQTGSEAFLDSKDRYSLADLIRTTIIVSANDSAMALAELVGGSESAFVLKMNQKAKEMGLVGTHFENPTGLPAAGHFSCARDIAVLAKDVVVHPIYRKYSKIYLDELVHPSGRKTQLVNTNRKFRNYNGFEGGKTGHTNEAGYCFSAVANRGDMRLVAVVFGAANSENRFDATKAMFDFGFENFKTKDVVRADKLICKAAVEYGKIARIRLFAKEGFCVFLPADEKPEFEIETSVNKLWAPVLEGEVCGHLKVLKDKKVIFETDLVAGEGCNHIGYKKVIKSLIDKF